MNTLEQIKNLRGTDLLQMFAESVRCDHYCPYECIHPKEFSLDELEAEIERRLLIAGKYD